MTMLYARSDIQEIAVAGVGHTHTKKAKDPLLAVDCVPCEPTLRAQGWATDPRQVELTPDEILEAETAREDIARFEQQMVAATAREAAASVRGAPGARRGAAR